MSITIQLDSHAVNKLIDGDAAFELELKQGCIREVVRRMMPRDPGKLQLEIIQKAVDTSKATLLAELGMAGKTFDAQLQERVAHYANFMWDNRFTKELPAGPARNRIAAQVKAVVETAFVEEITNRIGKVSENIDRLLEAHLARYGLEEKIAARMDAEFDKRVAAAVDARLDRMMRDAKDRAGSAAFG